MADNLLPQIENWQNRPLNEFYPIIYIDAILYSVRDNGVIRKLAAYVILGINTDGKKEVLSISAGDNESAKYWLSALNELPFTRILLANTSLEIVVCDFPIFSPICLKGILSFKLLSIIILCDNVICFAIIFSPLLIGKAARAYYTIKRNIIQIDN